MRVEKRAATSYARELRGARRGSCEDAVEPGRELARLAVAPDAAGRVDRVLAAGEREHDLVGGQLLAAGRAGGGARRHERAERPQRPALEDGHGDPLAGGGGAAAVAAGADPGA